MVIPIFGADHGRKDDLKNITQDTLFKAADELDKTFDKQMKRYVKSILQYVELMDKKMRLNMSLKEKLISIKIYLKCYNIMHKCKK